MREVALPLDLEEADRDPDGVLVRPHRGQVHHLLHHLRPPVRVLAGIGIRAVVRAQVGTRGRGTPVGGTPATLPDQNRLGSRCSRRSWPGRSAPSARRHGGRRLRGDLVDERVAGLAGVAHRVDGRQCRGLLRGWVRGGDAVGVRIRNLEQPPRRDRRRQEDLARHGAVSQGREARGRRSSWPRRWPNRWLTWPQG